VAEELEEGGAEESGAGNGEHPGEHDAAIHTNPALVDVRPLIEIDLQLNAMHGDPLAR